MFEIIEKDDISRVGLLHTHHGVIKTPTMFPVINPAKQVITLDEIRLAGFDGFITNAYLIKSSYGDIAAETGIHRLFDWSGPIMTDSGAYQLLQYGYIDVNPDDIISFQVKLGTDIGVILDLPTSIGTPKDVVSIEVEETIRRARRALLQLEEEDPNHRMLRVGPLQGGTYLDLLERSSKAMGKLDFDIYAIGSPTTLLEEYELDEIAKMIMTAKLNVPPGKPIHLFGAGHPLIMPLAVLLGVDLFDSASYVLFARDGRLIFRDRTVRLNELGDDYVIGPRGERGRTAKEVREMPKAEQEKLLALHNLHVIAEELQEIRQRIYEGSLWDYVEGKARQNIKLYKAYRLIRSNGFKRLIARLGSETKANTHELAVFDNVDAHRPEAVSFRERTKRMVKGEKAVILVGYDEKPIIRSPLAPLLDRLSRCGAEVYIYDRALGLVPLELSDVYPVPQMISHAVVRAEVTAKDVIMVVSEKAERLAKMIKVNGNERLVIIPSYKAIYSYADELMRNISCSDSSHI